MRLHVGDEFRDPSPAQARGPAPDRPVYRVTGVVRETQWSGLYEGKKLFTNYHFGRRRLEEAAEQEGLDVFLKTVQYTALDDREHVKDMREQAFFELRRVLGRGRQTRRAEDANGRVLGQPLSNLLPEPIDYLQVPNDRDVFAVSKPRQLSMYEPILIFERVHGEPLELWLRDRRPSLARRLIVLADLLDFLAVLHTEGLLLNGLGPEGVWINENDRLHYMGSEMVLEASRQKKQRRLYPPERYPAGFSPVEAFDSEQAIGGEMDLYSWAATAYLLITGESPADVARRQGQRFARFEDAHFARLEGELSKLPSGSVPRVQKAFRIAGSRFVHTWPDSFVGVLRECLLPQPSRRPASREALTGLWSTARPRAVPAALAVLTGKHVELLLASRDMEPGLEMVIRRAAGFVPRHPQDGQLVAEGPLTVHALDRTPLSAPTRRTPAPLPYYAVFTRVRSDGEPVYSPPASAALLDLSQPDALLSFAEEAASGEAQAESPEGPPTLPDRLALLEELPDAVPVARAWLGSRRPLIRRWGVYLLEGQVRTPLTRGAARALLLEHCATEDCPDLRQAALRALFQGERQPDPALVARAAMALGKGDVDAAIREARDLSRMGLDDPAIDAAVKALEMERRSPCPECQTPVRGMDRDEHLRTRHGYVALDGSLIPYGEALRALWRQVLVEQNETAAARLAELFVERHADRAATAYGNALQAQVMQHTATLGPVGSEAEPGAAWDRLGRCLAGHELTRRVCRDLLLGPDIPLRRLARLALIGVTASGLTGRTSAAEVRKSLESLCPQEDLDTRLAVCQRLQAAGASASAVRAVVEELELDREVRCSSCGKPVRRRDEAEHLRAAHGIYEIDGIRLPWEQALERLTTALLSEEPRAESAKAFVRLASDRLDAAGVAAHLTAAVVREQQRRGGVPPLWAVAELPQAADVVMGLIDAHPELAAPLFIAVGKQASLTLMERMAAALDRPALAEEQRRRVLEVILTNANAENGTRKRALDCFLRGADPLTAVRLLGELEEAVGRNPALDTRRREVRATEAPCPRCPTVLKLAQLEEHAWKNHRLVLDGGTWRDVWEVIEGCLRAHQDRPDDRLVARAVKLAERDDPKTGPKRLGRLARRLGVRHPLLPATGWFDALLGWLWR